MMRALALLVPLALSACATPEQIAARREAEAAQARAAEQRYVAALGARCESFGVPAGTPEMRQCMLQLHQTSQANRAALGAAIVGSGMLNPQPAPAYHPIPAYQAPTPRTTNCYSSGGYTNCTTR